MDYRLAPPLSEEQVRALRVGDTVTLDGTVFGMRDATLIRIFDGGQAPPADLSGGVCLHTAPNVKKIGARWEPLSVGTTTSDFIARSDNRDPLRLGDPLRLVLGEIDEDGEKP